MGSSIVPVIAALVAAAASIVAAVISAYFGHKNSKAAASTAAERQKLLEITRELRRAYCQESAYYELEELAAERISAATGAHSMTVKI